MAHTYGKASARASSAGNPITTASFTIATDETVLVLMIKARGATNRAGGSPTYGGVTMTQANSTQKAVTTPEASAELWYIVNPSIGAYTATIPNTGALTLFYTFATGKAKAGGASMFDGANGGNATSANPTPSAVTTTDAGAIGFAITAGGWTSWAPSAQAGTIIANTDDGADGGGEQYVLVANARTASTLSWTFATSDDWGAVSAYFKEVLPPTMENYKSVTSTTGISVTERIR